MLTSKNSWLALLLFALVLTFLTYLIQLLAPNIIYEGAYFIILFFLLLTLLTNYISQSALKHSPDRFSLFFFATITLRLLLSVGVVLVVLLQDIPDKITFGINFAVVYLIFLIFEIYALLTTLRSNFQKRAENVDKH